MITMLTAGKYRLIETKGQTKILYLDNSAYAWVQPTSVGEILVASHRPHKTDCVLAMGEYRLYTVRDEPHLSSHEHLELEVGSGEWQGYLLLTGLPTRYKSRRRIIPTAETISNGRNDAARSVSELLTSGLRKGELL